jgi:hypothetical protein
MNTQPNTAQATGPMTLEQGFQSLKAKMAEKGAAAEDQVIAKLDEEGIEQIEGEQPETLDDQTDGQENTEAVSDDESGAEQQEPDTRPIILPDGSEITVEEARKGYLRQSDFTRKTQAIAAEKESFVAQHHAAMQQTAVLYQQLASLQERPPTPDEMVQLSRTKTPEEFQQIQAYWQYKTTVMGQAQKAIEQQQAQAKQAAMAKAFEVLNAGEYEPTWKDPKALQTGLTTVTSYLTENYPNIPSFLIEGVDHPDLIVIADKARKFDELNKAKPKAALAVKGKPAPFKPGAKSTASPQSETVRLHQERFQKNPTPENAFLLEKAKSALRR